MVMEMAMRTPKMTTPVLQTKLTDVFRAARKTPDVKREKQVCRAVSFGAVKQEPVDCYENVVSCSESEAKKEPVNCYENVVNCSESEAKKESEMAFFASSGVLSGYLHFPGKGTGVNSFEIPKLVKPELLSPGSCVTNDSLFREGETPHVTAVSGDVAVVSLPPVKSLAMVQDDERTEQPLTPDTSSDTSTLEVPVATAAQVQKVVKAEAVVGCEENLIIAPESFEEEVVCGEEPSATHVQSGKLDACDALDMSPTEVQKMEHPLGCEVRGEEPSTAHVQSSRELDALNMSPTEVQKVDHPLGCEVRGEEPSAAHVQSRKRDALDISPTEVQHLGCEVRGEEPSAAHVQSRKRDALDISPTEVQQVDHPLGCEETSKAPVKRVLVHVKSEPVEIQADFSLKKLETVSSVKEELLNSTPTGVLSQPQASQKSSETEHSSSDSEDTDESEDEFSVEEIADTPLRKSQPRESQKEVKNRNINPGMRIQGGRIYDSSLGKTCHWCRQKTVEHHVKCRECTIHYCGPCLLNRNGENIMEELAEGVNWLCPKCRNGCGPGCENCCNCGPCRKAGGKAPTGQLIREARNAGFLNAHDYLVHLETGEGPDAIAQRKVGRDWTNGGRFEWNENSQAHGEPSSDDSSDEFTLNEVTSSQLHEGKIGMKFVKKFVQSQLKRKRGQRLGAMPAKRTHVEASFSRKIRDVHSIIASLNVPAVKRKEPEVVAAPRRAEKDDSVGQENKAPRNQSSGMRVKREFSDVGGSDVEVIKRRKLGEQGSDLFSRVKCEPETTSLSDDNPSVAGGVNSNEARPKRKFTRDADRVSSASESELTANIRSGGAFTGANGFSSSTSHLECPSDPQGSEYRTKLKFALAQPFDEKELEILEESVRSRKPVQKLRQMRGRVVDVVTEDEGFSYLDHHQDFALKLEEAQSPPLKLALLRGFFFWLQHSCMEGAFRPWPASPTESRPQSEDCMETEGPDCQVTAVVLQLDEGIDASQLNNSNEAHDCHNMVPGPVKIVNGEMTYNPLGSQARTQSLIPFKAKKNPVECVELPKMKGKVVTVQPYRVVLCLPAPALCKKW